MYLADIILQNNIIAIQLICLLSGLKNAETLGLCLNDSQVIIGQGQGGPE